MPRRALLDPDVRRGFAYVAPYKWRLAVILGLNLTGIFLALCVPYLTRTLVDDAFLGQNADALLRVVGLFAFVTAASFALNVTSGLRYTKLSAEILFDMRLAVFRHLLRLSPRFFARTPLGDIMSRINNDVGEIQRVLSDAALAVLGHFVFLVGSVAMMIWLDWRSFLAAAALLLPAVVAMARYRRRLEVRVQAMRERSADIGAFLIETLRGARTVAASNTGPREATRFRRRNDAFVDSVMAMQRLRYFAGGLPGLLLSGSTAVVFLYGGSRVIDGALTLGTFTAFMAYQIRLIGPAQGLMGLYASLATAKVSLKRVHKLLDEPIEVSEAASPVRFDVFGELVFEHVSSGHGRGGAVLDGFSLTVSPGEVIALVGASGSGKSTVADLMIRLTDPDAGRILLDGHDIRSMAISDLRASVAVVEQAPFVFNASLLENVRYANPNATATDVLDALAQAGLADFVASLPEGLATLAGEGGRALSTGERQRLGIARALLADPAVLVLDEATSALDPASEAIVSGAYRRVMQGRTTLIISHRRDLLAHADRVAVLVDGRVAEEGPPARLAASGWAFRRVFPSE